MATARSPAWRLFNCMVFQITLPVFTDKHLPKFEGPIFDTRGKLCRSPRWSSLQVYIFNFCNYIAQSTTLLQVLSRFRDPSFPKKVYEKLLWKPPLARVGQARPFGAAIIFLYIPPPNRSRIPNLQSSLVPKAWLLPLSRAPTVESLLQVRQFLLLLPRATALRHLQCAVLYFCRPTIQPSATNLPVKSSRSSCLHNFSEIFVSTALCVSHVPVQVKSLLQCQVQPRWTFLLFLSHTQLKTRMAIPYPKEEHTAQVRSLYE